MLNYFVEKNKFAAQKKWRQEKLLTNNKFAHNIFADKKNG